jgi:predicted metal-dependent hydrolase
VSGESHYFSGQRYRLRLCTADGPPKIAISNNSTINLHVRPGARFEVRQKVMVKWYREQLRNAVQPLLQKWQERLGVELSNWTIKKMKTKWGTCNPDTCRILINLELAKKSAACLKYVVVHELVHLLVRNRDDRFLALMNTHLPRWRALRAELNSQPLAHEVWREC